MNCDVTADGFFVDVAIVGTGVAGLYCALNLPDSLSVALFTKSRAEECDSFLAQGGICMLKNEADYESYFEDTMRAGHYENRKESVDIMIRSSPSVISDLIGYGANFERNADGSLAFTREGAHSVPRILFHEDVTGREITSHLLSAVKKRKNVRIFEESTMLDVIFEKNDECKGVVISTKNPIFREKIKTTSNSGNQFVSVFAKKTVWACGGIGGLFSHSTNYPHLTGDALALSIRHNIALKDIDYIQIHPTTLYSKKGGRAFLISESVRGEGGVLFGKNGERFVDELLPRDEVSQAIFLQMEKEKRDFVWLSMEKIEKNVILSHFRHIYEKCLEEGFDCTKEPIPVVPAQHYFMGGVDVDLNGKTSVSSLFAVGETACNGVHGKNRLASNSLLESLVFAKRAAQKINSEILEEKAVFQKSLPLDFSLYVDENSFFEKNRSLVLSEIEKARKNRIKIEKTEEKNE